MTDLPTKTARELLATWPREILEDLAYRAMIAAVEAPAKQSTYSLNATISWTTIHEIRELLSGWGYPIDAVIKERVRLTRAAQERQREARMARDGSAEMIGDRFNEPRPLAAQYLLGKEDEA